jgi:hypothetical protein
MPCLIFTSNINLFQIYYKIFRRFEIWTIPESEEVSWRPHVESHAHCEQGIHNGFGFNRMYEVWLLNNGNARTLVGKFVGGGGGASERYSILKLFKSNKTRLVSLYKLVCFRVFSVTVLCCSVRFWKLTWFFIPVPLFSSRIYCFVCWSKESCKYGEFKLLLDTTRVQRNLLLEWRASISLNRKQIVC